MGYPSNRTFAKEGGGKVFAGNQPFTDAVIQDYNGNQGSMESDENGKKYNVYDWLKVEYVNSYNDSLKVYAAPNTTGHKRKLYIELYSGQEYQVVKVTQN
ncbi:MAG: BACON domain-containing carbohydrate-binding protein [Bacteroidales bacterium]